jgi:hypothetical protein
MVMTLIGERHILSKMTVHGTKIGECFYLGVMLKHNAVVKFVKQHFAAPDSPRAAYLFNEELTKLIAAIESDEIPLEPLGEGGKPTGMEKTDAIQLLSQALEWVSEPDPGGYRSVKLSW